MCNEKVRDGYLVKIGKKPHARRGHTKKVSSIPLKEEGRRAFFSDWKDQYTLD